MHLLRKLHRWVSSFTFSSLELFSDVTLITEPPPAGWNLCFHRPWSILIIKPYLAWIPAHSLQPVLSSSSPPVPQINKPQLINWEAKLGFIAPSHFSCWGWSPNIASDPHSISQSKNGFGSTCWRGVLKTSKLGIFPDSASQSGVGVLGEYHRLVPELLLDSTFPESVSPPRAGTARCCLRQQATQQKLGGLCDIIYFTLTPTLWYKPALVIKIH